MDEFEAVYVASTLDIDLCDQEKTNEEFARFVRHFWNESARRADRQAREECAEICDKIGSTEKSEHGRYIAAECASAIRDTIAEE